MKNSGPAFIGAAMRISIGLRNGASPFFARPIQFAAMKPNEISSACRRLAFSTLAVSAVSTSTGASDGCRSSTTLSARPWL